MSTFDRCVRTLVASCVMAVLLLAAGDAKGQCTAYTVTPAATGNLNWAATSGLWDPPGSYPGENSACDTAADSGLMPVTIAVTTAIPNAISSLDLLCASCVVDLQPGSSLTLLGGTIANGASLRVNGGTLTLNGGITIGNSGAVNVNSGTLEIGGAGAVSFESGSNFTFAGGSVTIDSG